MKFLTALVLTGTFISVSCRKPLQSSAENVTEENEEGESEEDGLQSTDPNLVVFYLYPSSENVTYNEEIRIGEPDSLTESSYSPSKKLALIIHGFVTNFTCKFSQRVKNAYLESDLERWYNVMVLDWGALSTPKNQTNLGAAPFNDMSKNPYYQRAVQNVPKIGRRIMEFIDFLVTEKYLESPNEVHLIGFSLGAHIAGTAGYEVKQNMSTQIGRISGLDPAGPLYQSETNKALKLEWTDAKFVDIIHTNQGQSGYEGDIGHADFYPNGGGPNQNDCIAIGADALQSNVGGYCAHNRSWVYYIKTIFDQVYACKCVATPDYWCKATCPNKVLFGYPAPPTARGTFYVDINVKEECITPSCIHEDDY